MAPRWSLYHPDGRLIERDSASSPSGANRQWDMWNQLRPTPQDRRVVALAPARHFIAGVSRYDIVVLDMEFSVAP